MTDSGGKDVDAMDEKRIPGTAGQDVSSAGRGDVTFGSGWRPAWRDLAASDEIKALEADLDDAERRILADLASETKAGAVTPVVEAAPSPASVTSFGFRPGVVSRVSEVIDQTLTVPRGRGAARVVGDQALFGVSLTVDQAKALLDAWVALIGNDADSDDGVPPAPEVVAISEFLFVLFDPLAEKLSDLP
jgi:hypothetical protein